MARAKVFGRALAICFLLGCATPSKPPSVPIESASGEHIDPGLLERSLPGVVLLVTTRNDDKLVYGAGLLLDDKGSVLTNLHVVANAKDMHAMFYRADRTSYTPADGGLARYLFENTTDLNAATLVRGDPILDLAVVKVDADTSRYPKLPFREGLLQRGERVLALGHPQETVWSFTSGIVSTIHQAAIQHDAPVNVGNSGGPLIDANGRVVGINTQKLLKGAAGIAFARPIALAHSLLAKNESVQTLDLSTPEIAFHSCNYARELHSPNFIDCVDWGRAYDAELLRIERLAQTGQVPDSFIALLRKRTSELGREKIITLQKQATLARVQGKSLEEIRDMVKEQVAGTPSGRALELEVQRHPDIASLRRKLSNTDRYIERYNKRLFEKAGLKVDSRNPRGLDELMKMGIRLEAVKLVDSEHAWLAISGRNLDESIYHFSEYWARVGHEWKGVSPIFANEVATLPASWAPAIEDFEWTMEVWLSSLKEADSKSISPKAPPAKK